MKISKQARALGQLVQQLPKLVQSLTIKGRQLSTIEFQGEGYLGVMRLLKKEGPLTIPAIASHRGVSRQRIQKLCAVMSGNGLVEFTENPAHKSSHFIQLTNLAGSRKRPWAARFLTTRTPS